MKGETIMFIKAKATSGTTAAKAKAAKGLAGVLGNKTTGTSPAPPTRKK